jgi:hypothetical protein
MSRPTNVSKFEQADEWMRYSFGAGMRDYLTSDMVDPIGVAVVEVDQLIKKSGARKLLCQWQAEDAKSAAGRPAVFTPTAALALILLQLRLGESPLITHMTKTVLKLNKTHRKILGLSYDEIDERLYDRIWTAVMRLIRLVDEFPGRRDKILTEAEFIAVKEARNAEDTQMRRERMFTLANGLIEASRQMMRQDLLDRYEGNVAIDATSVPIAGKLGNPSSKVLVGDRRSINYDAGYHRGTGSHDAVTHSDAAILKKTEPGVKHHAKSRAKLVWGTELEIARTTANLHEKEDLFPMVSTSVSFHIPGAIKGEGLRLMQSIRDRGHRINLVIVDRAYNYGLYDEFAIPVRLLGGKLVMTYQDEHLGAQAYDARGFVQVSGSWYLDTIPQVLRDADKVILSARNTFKKSKLKDSRSVRREIAAAEDLYAKQLAKRTDYMLKAKGRMDEKWTRRYLLPTTTAEYAAWKKRPGAHQGGTVMMKHPNIVDPKDANPSGLKHEQYFPFGDKDWSAAMGMRNGVESVNRNLKRGQYEDLANPDHRAVRGNTYTYLVGALSAVVENLRQILSFYKGQLATKRLTPKNDSIPSIFWQSDLLGEHNDESPQPPG